VAFRGEPFAAGADEGAQQAALFLGGHGSAYNRITISIVTG
jgi:hypothetical protein